MMDSFEDRAREATNRLRAAMPTLRMLKVVAEGAYAATVLASKHGTCTNIERAASDEALALAAVIEYVDLLGVTGFVPCAERHATEAEKKRGAFKVQLLKLLD